jgi:hypothetical protein
VSRAPVLQPRPRTHGRPLGGLPQSRAPVSLAGRGIVAVRHVSRAGGTHRPVSLMIGPTYRGGKPLRGFLTLAGCGANMCSLAVSPSPGPWAPSYGTTLTRPPPAAAPPRLDVEHALEIYQTTASDPTGLEPVPDREVDRTMP